MSKTGVTPYNKTLQPSFLIAVTTRAQLEKERMEDKDDTEAGLRAAQQLQATLDGLTDELHAMRVYRSKLLLFGGGNDSI